MATLLQWPPRRNSHISTMATYPQQQFLCNGHLPTTATLLQWPPRRNSHLSTMATYPQQPFLCNGHLPTTATSLQWPPLYNSHFFCGQSIHWLLFKPLYNGQFLLYQRWPLWSGSAVKLSLKLNSFRIPYVPCRLVTLRFVFWLKVTLSYQFDFLAKSFLALLICVELQFHPIFSSSLQKYRMWTCRAQTNHAYFKSIMSTTRNNLKR